MYTCSTQLKFGGGGSKLSCAVYNILKATFKLVKPFYHHIISFLHLKICLTLEKYTKLDSQDKVKSEYILGKCWPFQSSSREIWRDAVLQEYKQSTKDKQPIAH